MNNVINGLNRERERAKRESATARHLAIINNLYSPQMETICKQAKICSIKKQEEKEMEEQRKLEEQNRKKEEEESRWKPCTKSDKFIYDIIQEWGKDREPEKERFYHAAFVLVWFIHPKFGICLSGGIERWGKDKNKMKPFGGRKDNESSRSVTAARELREETAGIVDIAANLINELPCVFILKTNPCYLLENRINHNEFRRRLQDQKDPHCQEMKAVVHIPFKEFYELDFDEIPGNGVHVNDISGRKTHVSSFFLHTLRGFKLI